ncbi:MAG: hypothetical protein ACYTGP_09465 [Planctomycetota bacterium]|jgi:hypothetical protein
MRALAASTFRQLVTIIVVVCVSICCCQAQMLTYGASDAQGCGPVEMPAPPSCCSGQCATETDPDSDEPPVPAQACKICCIKGSGLKLAPTLDIAELVTALPPVPELVEFVALPETPVLVPEAMLPYVAPPTLLRLRCALLV